MDYACPSCGSCIWIDLQLHDLTAYQLYTDGRFVSGSDDSITAYVKCPQCLHLVSVRDQSRLKASDHSFFAKLWFGKYALLPTEHDYYTFLQDHTLSNSDELVPRVWAWWLSNDPYRDKVDLEKLRYSQRPEIWHHNVERIRQLLTELTRTDGLVGSHFFALFPQLILPELYRQASDWDLALHAMNEPFFHSLCLPNITQQLRCLIESRNEFVQQISSSGS